METEIPAVILPVAFPGVAPGTDHSAMLEMYDALFHAATVLPDYGTAESALPPLDP